MEANFFRFAAEDLSEQIIGLRLEKVFMPAKDVWTFSLGSSNLVFYLIQKGGGFFLSRDRPPNPLSPPATAMWLRKRIKNRRIKGLINHWPQRRMAFELSGQAGFLVLDACHGVTLSEQFDFQGDAQAIGSSWPGLEDIFQNEQIWKEYPQITPPLRKALALAGRDEARKLLDQLRQGIAPGYFLVTDPKGREMLSCFRLDESWIHKSFESPLEAARACGQPVVHGLVSNLKEQSKNEQRRLKRLRKNLEKTRQDIDRLHEMRAESRLGEIIKSNLYQLDQGARLEEISLADETGKFRQIRLDPRLTVLQNMEKFYKRSAKGKRGLEFAHKREQELKEKVNNFEGEVLSERPAGTYRSVPGKKPAQAKGSAGKISLAYFKSSDEFIIIRARNKSSGHRLLSFESAPSDLWFHVQGGPGAHVILKRDHEGVEVPEKTLEEAAVLAALSSYRKNDLKAEVHCSRVRDVRKVKGLDQGRVVVDKLYKSILVKVDPEVESRLIIKSNGG